jgi:molybdopterin molybdotransferase
MRTDDVRGNEERVVSFDEALEIVLRQASWARKPRVERIRLEEASGRVLAVPITADRDQPPFNRSTRDGFAVRVADAGAGTWLAVAGQIRAGTGWEGLAAPDEALEIMTGAPVPDGADAVVMVEHVERSGAAEKQAIRLAEGRSISAGENIVCLGSEARAGDEVLTEGTVMNPAAVALAASCGANSMEVFARPTVSILATGDELVDVGDTPGPYQIRNSNSYGLAALVAEAGGTPLRQPVAPDRRQELEDLILRAQTADLLLLSGGVSMGEYDLVEEVLRELGAEFFFTGVRMQPGKPVVFGRVPEREGMRGVYFFGLPGNPVSTQVTFACFVEPLLRAMRGATAVGPRFVQATLGDDVPGKVGLMRVLPAKLTWERVKPEVRLVVWQGSGDMAANARANCYAILPPDVARFSPGDVVTVLLR